jgi:hypothetical protein
MSAAAQPSTPPAGMTWQQLIWAVRDAFGALVCRLKGGCNYNTYVFHSNCLYFCTRCNKEMTGRTFDDLLPMDDEQREALDWIDLHYGERA